MNINQITEKSSRLSQASHLIGDNRSAVKKHKKAIPGVPETL